MGAVFTSSKWQILQKLAESSYSPLQLSELLDTTIANISMQLRLLEAVGLVKKERISNAKKGMPRVIYSLAADFSYSVNLFRGYSDKSMKKLLPYQAAIERMRSLDCGYYLEKFFWIIEDEIDQIERLSFQCEEKGRIFLVAKGKITPRTVDVKDKIIDLRADDDHDMFLLYERGGNSGKS